MFIYSIRDRYDRLYKEMFRIMSLQSNRMVGDDGFNGCFSHPRPGLLQFTIEFRVIVVGCWLAEVVGFVTHAR